MAYIYDSDYRYHLKTNLLLTVESYKKILSLKLPIIELKAIDLKIDKDSKELYALQKDLNNINALKIVKQYLDNYDKSSLGDLMDMYGNHIDRYGGDNIVKEGRTYNEEHKYVSTAYRMNKFEKTELERRLKYLDAKGQTDLPVFQQREIANQTARKNIINKFTYNSLEEQEIALQKEINNFKKYNGSVTPLYFVKNNLEKHINQAVFNKEFNDEYVMNFFTEEQLEKIKTEDFNFYKISPEETEKFIEKIAKNEIIISEINPKPPEDQPE